MIFSITVSESFFLVACNARRTRTANLKIYEDFFCSYKITLHCVKAFLILPATEKTKTQLQTFSLKTHGLSEWTLSKLCKRSGVLIPKNAILITKILENEFGKKNSSNTQDKSYIWGPTWLKLEGKIQPVGVLILSLAKNGGNKTACFLFKVTKI